MQLLQAIAAYAAVAIGRSELLSTVWRYTYQDPLTGLANRRELERRFDEMDWETSIEASTTVRGSVGTTVTLSWGGTASGTHHCRRGQFMRSVSRVCRCCARIDVRTVYRRADYPSIAHSIVSGEAFDIRWTLGGVAGWDFRSTVGWDAGDAVDTS